MLYIYKPYSFGPAIIFKGSVALYPLATVLDTANREMDSSEAIYLQNAFF